MQLGLSLKSKLEVDLILGTDWGAESDENQNWNFSRKEKRTITRS
jgi:hypothetical protein